MDQEGDSATRRLVQAFLHFRKAEWHPRTIAGHTPSEINLLFSIRQSGKHGSACMNVSEISKVLHVTSPSITQLIKRLRADGLVALTRDPTDRRAVCLRLTERGDALTNEAARAFGDSVHGLVEYLGDEQSDQLATLLSKAHRYFSERASAAAQDQQNGVMAQ
jgi:DNA-binding MarR family transcriptional regulator